MDATKQVGNEYDPAHAAVNSADASARRPLLCIDTLGELRISWDARPLPLANRRARVLLAYLALDRVGARPREHLAGLLWSDSSEGLARNSLRQALFETRRALGPRAGDVLHEDRARVALRREAVITDRDAILAAIAQGVVPAALPTTASDGALLTGCEDLGPVFSDWLAATRTQTLNALLDALQKAFEDIRLSPAARRALAEAALRLDPLHETACRTVMRLAADAGEAGIALRAYATLYDAMGLELDQEPSEPTQVLVAEIKQGVRRPAMAAKPAPPPVVAVLPLRAPGGDATAELVGEAIVEGIVRVLSGLREPMVISGNSTRHLRGGEANLRETGAQIGAQYLVSGSVLLAATRGRIAVELAEVKNGGILLSQAFDVTDSDIFVAQDTIAANIAHALVPHVNASELRQSYRMSLDDLGAYHLMLRARTLMLRLEHAAFEEAGLLLREAALRCDGFAAVYATLADWFSLRVFQGWSTDLPTDIAALLKAARTAVELDPGHARAMAVLAHNLMMTEGKHDEALALFERAWAIAPNDAEALIWSVPTLVYSGNGTTAVARAERALLLSPQDPFLFRAQALLGFALYSIGKFSDAVAWGRRSDATNSNYSVNLRFTCAALAALGRIDDARALALRHQALEPRFRISKLPLSVYCRDRQLSARVTRDLRAAGLPE